MKFRLTPSFNDGKNDPPPTEIIVVPESRGIDSMLNSAYDEFVNDNGEPFGVGFTLKIERIV